MADRGRGFKIRENAGRASGSYLKKIVAAPSATCGLFSWSVEAFGPGDVQIADATVARQIGEAMGLHEWNGWLVSGHECGVCDRRWYVVDVRLELR